MARNQIVRRSFGRAAGPRRQTDWLASVDNTAFAALAASQAIFDQSFSGSGTPNAPFTIVRTRGSLFVRSDQVANAEEPFGAIGFAVVSSQAAAIGVTAIPTPISDEPSDMFFVWEPWAASNVVASAVGIDANGVREYKIDSKAMRKVGFNETVAVTIENANATAGALFLIKFRMLVKLH